MKELQHYIEQLLTDLEAAQYTQQTTIDKKGRSVSAVQMETYLTLGNFYEMKTLFGAATPPTTIPINLLYKAVIQAWKHHEVPYLAKGVYYLEFCDYQPVVCPWGKQYCVCKQLQAEWEDEQVTVRAHQIQSGLNQLLKDIEDID